MTKRRLLGLGPILGILMVLSGLSVALADTWDECIEGTQQVDQCILQDGGFIIIDYIDILTAQPFTPVVKVYNGSSTIQEVFVQTGCVSSGERIWFDETEGGMSIYTVEIGPEEIKEAITITDLSVFEQYNCENWQGGENEAFIMRGDFVGGNNPTIIYGDTFRQLDDVPPVTTTSLPGTGGCDVRFVDVLDPECDPEDGNVFYDDIEWLAETGITRGCNPPDNTLFCPKNSVTRGQMAAFLVRALELIDNGGGNLFIDDDSSVFKGDIDRLGTAGVTRGCNPPDNDRFCPDDFVTRGQMAAFLVRALGLDDIPWEALPTFSDVPDDHIFWQEIGLLAEHGITRGCNPPDNDRFCPEAPVTREQMAAFLHRALGQ